MRGERLTKLRQERHISQRELGEIVSVSGYTISAYELDRSDPSDDIKMRIAEYFDVSVDYLIGLIDEPLSYRRDENVVMLPRNFTEGQKKAPAGVPPGPGPGLGRGKCNGVKSIGIKTRYGQPGLASTPWPPTPARLDSPPRRVFFARKCTALERLEKLW